MSKFTELLESTMVRYQRTAFLPGDLVRFKKNWQKSEFAKANQDYAKKIQSFIESGYNLRLSITKPANPGVNGSFGSYEQQHDVFGDITLETAPGLYADFMTVPLELLEVVPLDNSLAPIPDKMKKKDPTQIKPSEYKPAKAGKTTAKDPSNQDVTADNLERQTGVGEKGDRKLNDVNVKIPGGKKWDDKKPGGRKNDWVKLKESSSLIQNDADLIFEAYKDSLVKENEEPQGEPEEGPSGPAAQDMKGWTVKDESFVTKGADPTQVTRYTLTKDNQAIKINGFWDDFSITVNGGEEEREPQKGHFVHVSHAKWINARLQQLGAPTVDEIQEQLEFERGDQSEDPMGPASRYE